MTGGERWAGTRLQRLSACWPPHCGHADRAESLAAWRDVGKPADTRRSGVDIAAPVFGQLR